MLDSVPAAKASLNMLASRKVLLRARPALGRLSACAALAAVVVAPAPSLGTAPGAAALTTRATVTIDPARQYQRIAGFGVSEGFGQAKALMNAPGKPARR